MYLIPIAHYFSFLLAFSCVRVLIVFKLIKLNRVRGTATPFHYNDFAGLEAALAAAGDGLAAIVMEPIRSAQPALGFLDRVRDEAHRRKALLVFDEVTAAFRMNTGAK